MIPIRVSLVNFQTPNPDGGYVNSISINIPKLKLLLKPPSTFPLIPARSWLSLLAFPFHIISSIFRFVFGFLRIPIPQLRFMGLNFYRARQFREPSRGGPDKWLRELEEETGAISIGRLKQPRGTTSSFNTEPGQSSSLTSRRTNGQIDDGRKHLPDFTISTYEEMLRLCQREMKIGCVILVSEEHDDVLEFKRYITESMFCDLFISTKPSLSFSLLDRLSQILLLSKLSVTMISLSGEEMLETKKRGVVSSIFVLYNIYLLRCEQRQRDFKQHLILSLHLWLYNHDAVPHHPHPHLLETPLHPC